MSKSDRQLSLKLRPPARHGGRRERAGRKPGANPLVRHRRRPKLASRHPCHVTLRVREDVPSLWAPAFVRAFEETLARGCDRGEFRLVHYALLRDHAHLIVEAKDRYALSRGMMSLSRRMVWAMLKTPREVLNAIRYVLLNAARHRRAALRRLDPASSGRWFDGWRRGRASGGSGGDASVAAAHTWLLRVGWRRLGLLDPLEVPGAARASP